MSLATTSTATPDSGSSRRPLISVIIPARNEVADLGDCLAAVAAQDVGRDEFEVVVIDGGSTDGTGSVAASLMDTMGIHGRVVVNPEGSTPTSLNAGLEAARGRVICRVDARSIVPQNYLRVCRDLLDADDRLAVVGGAQVPVAGGETLVARSIARGLRNRVTTGLARYRRRSSSGPADTVYLGAFRRDDLVDEGGWDVRFRTNQDYDLNRRMGRRGVVWFQTDLAVGYIPRASFGALARQYRRFGRWKAAIWVETDQRPSSRHLLLLAAPPIAFVLALLGLRRHPTAAVGLGLVFLVAVDRGAPGSAPVPERIGGVAAAALSSGCWWFGTVEQLGREVLGERLLGEVPAAGTDR